MPLIKIISTEVYASILKLSGLKRLFSFLMNMHKLIHDSTLYRNIAKLMSESSTYFEKQRDMLVQEIGVSIESVVYNLDILNRSLNGSISVGKEFDNVGRLWSHFYDGLNQLKERNNKEETNKNDQDPDIDEDSSSDEHTSSHEEINQNHEV